MKITNQDFFESSYKTRDKLSITFKQLENDKIIFEVTLGAKIVKKSQFDILIEKLGNLETKVNTIETKVNTIETKVNVVDAKVKEIETKVNAIDTKVKKIDTKVKKIDTKVNVVDGKVDKLTEAVIELQTEAKVHGWNIVKNI